MLSVFKEYNAIKENIGEIINASGYKNEYLAKKISVTSQNFAVKKKRGTWNSEELEKLVDVLAKPNEDVENALMLELMRSRKNDETVPLSELKNEFGWK